MKDAVEGTAKVVGISSPDPTATTNNYRMECVVSGPGIAPRAVVHEGASAPVSKWPSPGDTLPIVIDRADPTHFVVLWKQLTSGHEQAMRQAEAIADQMRSGAGAGAGGGGGAGTADFEKVLQQFGAQGNLTVTFGSVPDDAEATAPAAPAAPPVVGAAEILARGVSGFATLLGTFSTDQPSTTADHTAVGLMLNVMIDGHPPYQVQNLYRVPAGTLNRLTPGALLPVKVDTGQLGVVAVDWEAG